MTLEEAAANVIELWTRRPLTYHPDEPREKWEAQQKALEDLKEALANRGAIPHA